MRRCLAVVAIACAVTAAGCGSRDAPAAKPVAGKGGPSQQAVGKWSVTAIDGKPIPVGSSVSLDYRPDGQLIVEANGKDAPTVDKEALKSVLNSLELSIPVPLVNATFTINSLTINVNGRQIEMKRK